MSFVEHSLVDELSIPSLEVDGWNQDQDILSFLNSDENLSGEHSPLAIEGFSSGDSPSSSPLHDLASDNLPINTASLLIPPPSSVKEETVSAPTTPVKSKNGKRVRDEKKQANQEPENTMKGRLPMNFDFKDIKLNLTRDDLLKFSSKELEDYAHSLSNARPLSVDEEKQLKRQRRYLTQSINFRLIKNRESAQLSRLRKKVYIEELEKKVAMINAENEQLKSQLNDKRKLQDEVCYLQGVIKQYQQVYGPLPTTISSSTLGTEVEPSVVLSLPDTPSPLPTTTNSKKGQNQKNLKTAGVCLLLVLFSFGLLFQSQNNQLALPDAPALGRSLLSVESAKLPIVAASAAIKVKQEQLEPAESIWKGLPKESLKKLSQEAIVVMNKYLPDYDRVDEKEQGKKKMKIMDQDDQSSKSVVVLGSESQNEENATAIIQNTQFQPRDNTAYVYCPDAQQLTSPRVKNPSKPENIALLIPSSIFQASLNKGLDPSLLEVSCQVMSYYSWPTIPTTSTTNNASSN